jgi:hypothetical protein
LAVFDRHGVVAAGFGASAKAFFGYWIAKGGNAFPRRSKHKSLPREAAVLAQPPEMAVWRLRLGTLPRRPQTLDDVYWMTLGF